MRKLIKKYPVVKTMVAYLCINTAADMNEQIFIKGHRRHNYDVWKTVRIGATGCFVMSPMIYHWIKFLDRFIHGRKAITVVKKVFADVLLFAPVALSTFFITTNILEGKKDLTEEWKQKFFKTWTTGMMYWPFVQTVNFAIIPPQMKTSVYMPMASFIWMNYLCFIKDKPVIHHSHHNGGQKSDSSQNSLAAQSSKPTDTQPKAVISTCDGMTTRITSPASTKVTSPTSTIVTSPVSVRVATPVTSSSGPVI